MLGRGGGASRLSRLHSRPPGARGQGGRLSPSGGPRRALHVPSHWGHAQEGPAGCPHQRGHSLGEWQPHVPSPCPRGPGARAAPESWVALVLGNPSARVRRSEETVRVYAGYDILNAPGWVEKSHLSATLPGGDHSQWFRALFRDRSQICAAVEPPEPRGPRFLSPV